MKRTDVIVDYHGVWFVMELRIWYGEKYIKCGEQQLVDYLKFYKAGEEMSF